MHTEKKRELSEVIINNVRLSIEHIRRNDHLPTIIFLHESFGCIRHWKDFPEKLGEATGLSTLVYDRQGYGQSDPFSITKRTNTYLDDEADVLNKIIHILKLNQVILFGHSDGGSIALIAAAKYPGPIRAVITEGAHVFVEEITREGVRHAEMLYRTSNLKERLSYYHGEKTEMVFRLWADTWLSEEFRKWNMEHYLPKIEVPVLLIQGEHDEYGSVRQVESIQQNVGGKSFRCLPDAGHTPHRETPEIVIESVCDFLQYIH